MNNLSSLPPNKAVERVAAKPDEEPQESSARTDSPKPFDSHLPLFAEKRAERKEKRENAASDASGGPPLAAAPIVGFTAPPAITPSVPFEVEQSDPSTGAIDSDSNSAFPPVQAEEAGDAGRSAQPPVPTPDPPADLVSEGPSMIYFEPKPPTKAPAPISSTPNELPTPAPVPTPGADPAGLTPPSSDPAPPSASSTVPVATPDVAGRIENAPVPPSPTPRPAKSSGLGKALPVLAGATGKNKDEVSPVETPSIGASRTGGTDAAKQHPAMPIAELETRPESKLLNTPALPAQIDSPALRVLEPSQSHDFLSGNKQDESLPQPGTASLTMPPNADTPITTSHSVEPPHKATHAEQVTHLFREVTEASERLRTDGRTHVEVQIKLHDGEQLTVRLQMHAGEVRAVFKTDSTEWREAIARGWSNFSSNSAERGLRVTTPVFESPSAQPGLNDFNNQRHDGREEAESTASGNPLFPPPLAKNRKPLTTASTASPLRQPTAPAASLAAWA